MLEGAGGRGWQGGGGGGHQPGAAAGGRGAAGAEPGDAAWLRGQDRQHGLLGPRQVGWLQTQVLASAAMCREYIRAQYARYLHQETLVSRVEASSRYG